MPAVTQPTTREAVLDRAVDLASEEGLEGLTIGRLAGELEMSKSGLFGLFGSKQELQLATIEEAAKRFFADVIAPTAEQKPGEERLRALCNRFIGYLEKPIFPGGCFWGAVSAEFDSRPGPVRDAIEQNVSAWIALLRHQAELAGVKDPEQLAFELQAIVAGANSAFQLFGDRKAFDQARTAIDARLS